MAGQAVKDQAFVTLATNDTYALGAMVLGHSLRGAGTTRQLAVMITHGVSETIRGQLSQVFDLVAIVDVLDSQDVVNLALLTRTDLGVTFTKLHCWRLTQYSKCVFMDADTMVLSNIDELFDREELSAAPDAGWPDCFNSGVFVFKPSDVTYKALLDFAVSHGSFDGGDQGLLNLYFSDWATKDIKRHLPFLYNVVSQAFYSYLPAFTRFGKNIKVVHFIGAVKPWHHTFNTATGQVDIDGDAGHNKDFLQKWWQLFLTNVQPNLDPEVTGFRQVCIARSCVDTSNTVASNSRSSSDSLQKLVTTTEKLSDPLWSWQTPVSDIHYEMTSPYNPPDVQIFYEPRSPDVADRRESVVVDNKDDRNYDFYESFYAEPPMSHSECYPTPSQTYTAKHFHNTLVEWSQESADQVVDPVDEIEQDIDSDFVEVPVDLEDDVNNPDHADHDISNSSCIHSDAKQYSSDDKETDNSCYHSEEVVFDDRTVVSPRLDKDDQVHISPDEHCDKSTVAHNHVSEPPSQSSNITVSKTEESSAINEETNLTVPKASEELEPDTKCSDTAVIGLVGEMASLRLETVGGYTRDQLADRQRQYDWEMGQVDYRGIDAFQNIQHRLTEAMTGPPPEVTFGAVPAKDTTSADKS